MPVREEPRLTTRIDDSQTTTASPKPRLALAREVAERVRIDGDTVIVVRRDGVVTKKTTEAKDPERVRRAARLAHRGALDKAS